MRKFIKEAPSFLAMLRNAFEAAERSSPSLRNFVLLEGAKYYDRMSDTTKARRIVFTRRSTAHEAVDSEEMLLRLMAQFRRMRFIPE